MNTVKICPVCQNISSGDSTECIMCGSRLTDTYVDPETWKTLSALEKRTVVERTVGHADPADKREIKAEVYTESEKGSSGKAKGLGCLILLLIIGLCFGRIAYLARKDREAKTQSFQSQSSVAQTYPTLGLKGFATGMIKGAKNQGWEVKTYGNKDGSSTTYINVYDESERPLATFMIEYDKDGDPGILETGSVMKYQSSLLSSYDFLKEWEHEDIYDWLADNLGENDKKEFGNIVAETVYNPEREWVTVSLTTKEYIAYADAMTKG